MADLLKTRCFTDDADRRASGPFLTAPPSDYLLGRAFKSLTALVSGRLAVSVPDDLKPFERRRNKWRIRMIEERKTLRRVLEVTAGASLLGVGSAKASYYHSLSQSQYSLFLYVDVQAITHILAQSNNQLLEDLIGDLQAPPDRIYANYGDRYVAEVAFGGEYFALIQYVAHTENEYQKMRTEADGVSGDFAASAEVSESLERMRQFTSLDAQHYLAGAKGGYPDTTGVTDYIQRFPDKVAGDGVQDVVEIGTCPLNEAQGFPRGVSPIDVSQAANALETLNVGRERVEDLDRQWAKVISKPYYFVGEDLDAAAESRKEIGAIQVEIGDRATAIVQAPTQPSNPTVNIPEKLFRLPERVPTFVPTIRSRWETVKRDVHEGDGVAGGSIDIAITDPTDTNRNWFPNRSGSFANVRWLEIGLKDQLPHVELRCRGLFRLPPPHDKTDWITAGGRVQAPGGHLMLGIAFDLQGQMRDAYWIEYQVHVMRLADSEIWGNTERAGRSRPLGDFATKQGQLIEGVRLAIWPKE